MVRRDFKSVAPVEWPAFKACYDSGVLERLLAFAAQHALFVPEQRIGVAVSGGADSVFLLRALHQLAPRWNLHLSVVHVDHGIRGEASREDAEFVRALASEHGLPFHLHQADVLASEGNLEQAARRARQPPREPRARSKFQRRFSGAQADFAGLDQSPHRTVASGTETNPRLYERDRWH